MRFPFTLAVGSSAGSEPEQEVVEFESWTLERNLDDGCQVVWTMDGGSAAARVVSELASDVWLYDGGVLDQRFRIIDVTQEWTEDGFDLVTVTAACYRRLLASRHVWSPLSFSAVSQGLILWGLYEHTQALPGGDWGVTLGDPGPVVTRDRDYEVGANLLELAVNLSQVIDGLLFDVNPEMELVVSQAALQPVAGHPVAVGGNASSLLRPSGAAQFANAGIGFGDEEATVPSFAEAPDVATDPRGRWERMFGNPSTTEQATVAEYAAALVTNGRSPAVLWEFTIDPDRYQGDSRYQIGNFVRVVQPASTVAPVGPPPTEVWVQVLTQTIEATGDGGVTVAYTAFETGSPL